MDYWNDQQRLYRRRRLNASYGHFSIFKSISIDSLIITPAMGQYIIRFTARFEYNDPQNKILFLDNFNVSLFFGEKKRNLAIASPDVGGGNPHNLRVRNKQEQRDSSIGFVAYVPPITLEVLEEIRAGKDADFCFGISGTAKGYDGSPKIDKGSVDISRWGDAEILSDNQIRTYKPEVFYQEKDLKIPQSQWCDILNKSGFSSTLLFEVPLIENDEFKPIISHIEESRKAFSEGRYSDTVARCREALDGFLSKDDVGANHLWSLVKNHNDRENLSLKDTFRLSWGVTQLITNAAHHRNNMTTEFTRPMAQYVLGSTTMLLSLAMKERDLFMKPEKNSSENEKADDKIHRNPC